MHDWQTKWRRVRALIVKETRQVVRDPSSIAIGVVMPVILILLFGFGLSLDVTSVPVAIVAPDASPGTTGLLASLQLSRYFRPQLLHSMHAAQELMVRGQVDGIVQIPPDFERRLAAGDAEIEVLV